MTSEQHDDHCRLVCEGVEWEILAKRGDRMCVLAQTTAGAVVTHLDLRGVDWDAYTSTANAWLQEWSLP